MEKLTFYAPSHTEAFGDTTVRVSPEAKKLIEKFAKQTKRSNASIADEMIKFAARFVEIVNLED